MYVRIYLCILHDFSLADLHMHFPITIATVPFRIPNSNQTPIITYGESREKEQRMNNNTCLCSIGIDSIGDS